MDRNLEPSFVEKVLVNHRFDYDAIIVGGGPAGITAAMGMSQNGMKVLLIEKAFIGGRVSAIASVMNFPAIAGPVSGQDLVRNMDQQLKDFSVTTLWDEVIDIDCQDSHVTIRTAKDEHYSAPFVVLALGLSPKKLGVPGEDKYYGLGVSYFVVPDKDYYSGKRVAIIGGGNYALSQALYIADVAKQIVVIYRQDDLKGFQALRDRVELHPQCTPHLGVFVEEIIGDHQVRALRVTSKGTGCEEILEVDAVVVCVGMYPQTGYLQDIIQLDERGFIVTDEYMCTSATRLYAAGDVRSKMIRQIITAASDGLIAAKAIYERC